MLQHWTRLAGRGRPLFSAYLMLQSDMSVRLANAMGEYITLAKHKLPCQSLGNFAVFMPSATQALTLGVCRLLYGMGPSPGNSFPPTCPHSAHLQTTASTIVLDIQPSHTSWRRLRRSTMRTENAFSSYWTALSGQSEAAQFPMLE
jgi:hypothetical protein